MARAETLGCAGGVEVAASTMTRSICIASSQPLRFITLANPARIVVPS